MSNEAVKLEQALLGWLMSHSEDFKLIKPIILKFSYFTTKAHAWIYRAMLELHSNEKTLDELAIGAYLEKHKKLKSLGGYEYLATLVANQPSNANVVYYAKLLREKYIERKIHEKALELQKTLKSSDNQPDLAEIVDKHISSLQSLRATLSSEKNQVRTVSEVLPLIYRQMELITKGEVIPALETNFKGLDKYLGGGLHRGELNVLAGRPSAGKTSFALNIADNLSPDTTILFISLETTAESIARDKLIAKAVRIPAGRLRTPNDLKESEWDKLGEAFSKIGMYKNFRVCDQASMTIDEIENLVQMEVESDGGIDVFMLDYLQLVRNPLYKKFRERQIADICQRLKAVIKHHSLYSLILAQLNRESEKQNREPQMSDLRESGQLEQDADAILFLYKQSQNGDDGGGDDSITKLKIAKNKNGPIGDIDLFFDKNFATFKDIER